MAVPGHLRRGVHPVRHHSGVREATQQGRNGRERHGPESRTVSTPPIPSFCLCAILGFVFVCNGDALLRSLWGSFCVWECVHAFV